MASDRSSQRTALSSCPGSFHTPLSSFPDTAEPMVQKCVLVRARARLASHAGMALLSSSQLQVQEHIRATD